MTARASETTEKKTQRAQSKYYSESNVKVKKLLKNLMCGIIFFIHNNIKFIISSLARRIRLVKILAHTQYTRHRAYFFLASIFSSTKMELCVFMLDPFTPKHELGGAFKWRPSRERIRVIWT